MDAQKSLESGSELDGWIALIFFPIFVEINLKIDQKINFKSCEIPTSVYVEKFNFTLTCVKSGYKNKTFFHILIFSELDFVPNLWNEGFMVCGQTKENLILTLLLLISPPLRDFWADFLYPESSDYLSSYTSSGQNQSALISQLY